MAVATGTGVRWSEFGAAAPLLARRGERMLYEYGGLGLGFLATVRPDGGPRVHPVCPVLTAGELYAFIIPGPKLKDLRRDPRYALHSETVAPPRQDDGFYVAGTVREVSDRDTTRAATGTFLAERNVAEAWPGFEDQVLFELLVDRCLLTLTTADDEFAAGPTVWRADGATQPTGR